MKINSKKKKFVVGRQASLVMNTENIFKIRRLNGSNEWGQLIWGCLDVEASIGSQFVKLDGNCINLVHSSPKLTLIAEDDIYGEDSIFFF